MSQRGFSDEAPQSNQPDATNFPDFHTYDLANISSDKENLSDPAREFYDTLCLVSCHEIPTRFVQKYSDHIAELHPMNLVFLQRAPPWADPWEPKERYFPQLQSRDGNLDLLRSSPLDFRISFSNAYFFYLNEVRHDSPRPLQEAAILGQVYNLGLLYDLSREQLGTCAGLGLLLDESARAWRELGKMDLAEVVEGFAERVREDRRTFLRDRGVDFCERDV